MDTEGGGYGNSFALMKDAGTNGYYIYKFKAAGQKVAGYEVNKSLATDMTRPSYSLSPQIVPSTVCGG